MASPTVATVKRLFLLTGNRCAFPDCGRQLIDEGGTLIAEVCHIRADNSGGPRFDAAQTEKARQSYENLIVLCPTHHATIDGDVGRYSVEALLEMKRVHESKASSPLSLTDGQARNIASHAAPAALGAAAAHAVLREIWPTESSQHGEAAQPDDLPALRARIAEVLRFGPEGTVYRSSAPPLGEALADFFVRAFKEGGWRAGSDVAEIDNEGPAAVTMLFVMDDRHQLPIANETVHEVFGICGFRDVAPDGVYQLGSDERSISIRTAFAARQ